MEKRESKFLSVFQKPSFPNILKLSDGRLYTEDGCKFHIHRYILAKNSEYFHALFTGVNRGRREFRIPYISGDCLCDILCYLYTGDIVMTSANLTDLLIGTNYLLLTDIYQKIKQNVKTYMIEDNCWKVAYAASLIGDKDIIKESIRFIVKRFEKITADHRTELEDIPSNMLYEILSSPSLYVFNENAVWEVIVQWTQKNNDGRQSYVPELISVLAVEEVDEKLATEILHHEIVSNNPHMVLIKHIKTSNYFANNHYILSKFIQYYSNDFISPCYFRIPRKLFVITSFTGGWHTPYVELNPHGKSNLYITYDEDVDLWCKIIEVDFRVAFMTVIEHNIFIFGEIEQIWLKFNLIAMDWTPMENFRFDSNAKYFIIAINRCIYVFFESHPKINMFAYDLKIYDTRTNKWFNGISPRDINIRGVVAIDNGIFIVGWQNPPFSIMVMKRFDVVTRQWTMLPFPKFVYYFPLVAYHKKIYLATPNSFRRNRPVSEVQVFDLEAATWSVLPEFPYECKEFHAAVLCDHLFIYGGLDERRVVSAWWNEENQCWEKVANLNTSIDFFTNHFSTIEDANIIRMITKENRNPEAELEETRFSFNKNSI